MSKTDVKTLSVRFNYDANVLRKASIDLDSGTLLYLRHTIVEALQLMASDPTLVLDTRQRALIEALTAEM